MKILSQKIFIFLGLFIYGNGQYLEYSPSKVPGQTPNVVQSPFDLAYKIFYKLPTLRADRTKTTTQLNKTTKTATESTATKMGQLIENEELNSKAPSKTIDFFISPTTKLPDWYVQQLARSSQQPPLSRTAVQFSTSDPTSEEIRNSMYNNPYFQTDVIHRKTTETPTTKRTLSRTERSKQLSRNTQTFPDSSYTNHDSSSRFSDSSYTNRDPTSKFSDTSYANRSPTSKFSDTSYTNRDPTSKLSDTSYTSRGSTSTFSGTSYTNREHTSKTSDTSYSYRDPTSKYSETSYAYPTSIGSSYPNHETSKFSETYYTHRGSDTSYTNERDTTANSIPILYPESYKHTEYSETTKKSSIMFGDSDDGPVVYKKSTKSPHRSESTFFPAITSKPFHNSESYNEDHEAITNKPNRYSAGTHKDTVKQSQYEPTTEKPTNYDPTITSTIFFPNNDGGIDFGEPVLRIGKNEKELSASKTRQAYSVAALKCSYFRSYRTHTVQAIALLPSPDPVTVKVEEKSCYLEPLVVGGSAVEITDVPHMAALGWKNAGKSGYSWKCGGSLISDQFVLTAAHCTYQELDSSVVAGTPRVVQLGSSKLDSGKGIIVPVQEAIKHPAYKPPVSYNDIALIKMARRVEFSDNIMPACLGQPPAPREKVVATGWGSVKHGGPTSNQLLGVSLAITDLGECARSFHQTRRLPNGPMKEVQVCAGDEQGGKDTCEGDSGGPIMVRESDCSWRVVGITSLGLSCGAPKTPAIYALPNIPWIAYNMWM